MKGIISTLETNLKFAALKIGKHDGKKRNKAKPEKQKTFPERKN